MVEKVNRRGMLRRTITGSTIAIGAGAGNVIAKKNQDNKYEGVVYDPVSGEVTGTAKLNRNTSKKGLRGVLQISGTELSSKPVNVNLNRPDPVSSRPKSKGIMKSSNNNSQIHIRKFRETVFNKDSNMVGNNMGVQAENIGIDIEELNKLGSPKDDAITINMTESNDISLSGSIKGLRSRKKSAFLLSPRSSQIEIDHDASTVGEAIKFGSEVISNE